MQLNLLMEIKIEIIQNTIHRQENRKGKNVNLKLKHRISQAVRDTQIK